MLKTIYNIVKILNSSIGFLSLIIVCKYGGFPYFNFAFVAAYFVCEKNGFCFANNNKAVKVSLQFFVNWSCHAVNCVNGYVVGICRRSYIRVVYVDMVWVREVNLARLQQVLS